MSGIEDRLINYDPADREAETLLARWSEQARRDAPPPTVERLERALAALGITSATSAARGRGPI